MARICNVNAASIECAQVYNAAAHPPIMGGFPLEAGSYKKGEIIWSDATADAKALGVLVDDYEVSDDEAPAVLTAVVHGVVNRDMLYYKDPTNDSPVASPTDDQIKKAFDGTALYVR